MKLITTKLLRELNACEDGIKWVKEKKTNDLKTLFELSITDNHLNWSNWLFVRLMNKKQRVQYVVFASEQVIEKFEKKYPSDKRPRLAIEAAKKYIKNPSEASAAYAAYAAYAASAASAVSAASEAYEAYEAYEAFAACEACEASAASEAYEAYETCEVRKKIMIKILKYGYELIKIRK